MSSDRPHKLPRTNIFVQMAAMAALFGAALRENAYRTAGMDLPQPAGRSRAPGPRNPAGSKFLLRAYKAKHGYKAESLDDARGWYASYLTDKDRAVREREARRRAERAVRRNPPLRNTA